MSKSKKRASLPELSDGIYGIDSHCHLDMEEYDADREVVIERALRAGIKRMMSIGIDLASSRAALELAGRYDAVFCTVGVHPHYVATLNDDIYRQIAQMAPKKEVKAFGEIGLDYAKNYAPKDVQRYHFARQVDLAKELALPIIIHDREAHEDVMKILRAAAPFPAGGVMHCFSGDCSLAREVMDLGLYISIPGVVTFNKAQVLQEVVRFAPLTSLLLETDGPFLTPVPYRGKRNEPAYVLYTAQKVAELKGISLA